MGRDNLLAATLQDKNFHELNQWKLIKELLAYQAKEQDREVSHNLLKDLILKYSEAEKKLAELNQLKNKFLGIAAHDLRNPLTSIRGFSEILLSEEAGPVSAEQKEFLEIINKTSDEMLHLVNDLLDVSVIESGKLDLTMRFGSLKKILADRIRLLHAIAEKKNITVEANYGDVPDVRFDASRISQVGDNLIGNAIKFSPNGSRVYVSLQQKERRLQISVRDEGPGLSSEDLQKLFGTFQKLSARPTGGEKSTGLGLAIVKKIIDAHQGEVWAESTPGRGATFSFNLPAED